MNSLLDPILNSVRSGDLTGGFIVIAVALIWNLKKIVDFADERADRHRKFVEDMLKVEFLAAATKEFLKEELNYFIFRKVYGIAADATLRDKLKDVISRSEGEASIRQFAKASQFIRMRRGKLSIEVTPLDRVWSFVNFVMSGVVALFALALFMLPGLAKISSITNTLVSMGLGLFLFAFTGFMVSEAMRSVIARRLSPIVERLEQKHPGDS